jgi:hypothetical protein
MPCPGEITVLVVPGLVFVPGRSLLRLSPGRDIRTGAARTGIVRAEIA